MDQLRLDRRQQGERVSLFKPPNGTPFTQETFCAKLRSWSYVKPGDDPAKSSTLQREIRP